jgi:hypothetical protein
LRESFERGERAAPQAVTGGWGILRGQRRGGKLIPRFTGICGRVHGVPYRLIGKGARDSSVTLKIKLPAAKSFLIHVHEVLRAWQRAVI